MKAILLIALISLTLRPSVAREWRSAEGGRTLEGDFVRVSEDLLSLKSASGQAISVKLNLLSFEDQAFARAAQTTSNTAMKMGPQALELVQSLTGCTLCRLGVKMSNGATLFTGEQVLLIGSKLSTLKPGTKLINQLLYPGGARHFHSNLGGGAVSIRSFALDLEEAVEDAQFVAAGTRPTDVFEPTIEISEATTLGFAVSEEGLVLVDSTLLEGATAISVDIGSDQALGKVIASDPALGVSLVACKGTFQVARIAPRKPVEIGQPIYALSLGLTTTKRSVADPSITKGIISKLSGPGGRDRYFQHDAAVDTEALGGLVLSEKGDVLGLMIPRSRIKGAARKSATEPTDISSLGTCLRTEALMAFLKSVPKVSATRLANSSTLQESGEAIKKSAIILRITKETRREVTPQPPKVGATTSGKNTPPVTGATEWSLSKTGVRHSAKCRYYDAAKACQATDGTPCKICGG